jgi:hypothetical protein
MAALFGVEWLSLWNGSLHNSYRVCMRGSLPHCTCGRYGRGLPVPMPSIAPGTDLSSLVDFVVTVTGLSSVIAGLFALKT